MPARKENTRNIFMIIIKPFNTAHQKKIDIMTLEISNEFETPISNNTAPVKITLLDKYWVAFKGNEIVGTVGILKIEKQRSVLKNMFVKKNYRGKEFNTSHLLLQKAFEWCNSENITSIYLGTMKQFIGAHKFYEKNGFQRIIKNELPTSFIHNPIDSVFYKLTI